MADDFLLDSVQMPYSQEAEQAVLGSVLIEPACFPNIQAMLRPDDFYLPQHQAIYGIFLELDAKGAGIDPVVTANMLTQVGTFDIEAAKQYLFQMAQMVFSTANVEQYAAIVREKHYLRSLIEAARKMLGEASTQSETADKILDAAEQAIYDIRQGKMTGGPSLLRDIIQNEVFATLRRISSPEKDEYKGFTSGYAELDHVLNGFNRSDLVLIGARPAMGKTSVALRLAQNIALQAKKRVVFFTLEMTKEQVAQRVLSMEALVDGHKMRSGEFTDSDWENIGAAVGRLSEADLWFDDTSSITVAEIKARVRRLKGVDCVVIDYLGLIQSGTKTENRVQEVSQITRQLKMMAKDLNIPVIVAAQLSRGTEGRGKSHRPQLSDLRESGSIEQDADIVLLLYREQYYIGEKEDSGQTEEVAESNDMEIIVAKNRHGFTKTVEFIWDAEHTLIRAKETNYDYA
ncbi:MAG: replicative DNA helicase [Oscillospiraceae bacterium]|nr:replicative DNA helicase [Oscillospiraceae bacterium]